MLPLWIVCFKEALSVKQAGQCHSVLSGLMVPACTGGCLKYSVLEGQVAHRAVFEKTLGAVQAGTLQTSTAVSAVALAWAGSCLLQLL